ncbi:MAG: hypothetical protein AAGI36_04895 [Pseudomonadota bacterium]
MSEQDGFQITGLDATANAAPRCSALGDVDGDGRDDFIIAGRSVLSEQGVFDDRIGYLLYGASDDRGATVDVTSFGDVLGSNPDGVPDPGSIIRSEVDRVNFFGSARFEAVGDVNGDGLRDFFVSSKNGLFTAKAYVVYGDASGLPADIRLDALDGSSGYVIPEFDADTGDGAVVVGIGDINGDGFDDIALGQPSYANNAGRVLFLFGNNTAAPTVDLENLSFSQAAQITGTAGEQLGALVAAAGDVNGDGFDDVFLSDPSGAPGATGIVFGGSAIGGENIAPVAADDIVAVSTISGTTARFSLFANNGNGADRDANLDALWVLAIAANTSLPPDEPEVPTELAPLSLGQPLVGTVPGSAALTDLNLQVDRDGMVTVDLSGVLYSETVEQSFAYRLWDGRDGFATATATIKASNNVFDLETIENEEGFFASTRFDFGVSGRTVPLGDVNGDGVADFAFVDPNERVGDVFNAGRVFVSFGSDALPTAPGQEFPGTPLRETLDLTGRFDGISGFTISGADRGNAGSSLAGAGDLNGDGIDDLIIGAPIRDGEGVSRSGAAFVVYGGTPAAADFSLAALDGTNGFRLTGAQINDTAGSLVAAAGDVNGDGFGDALISSRGTRGLDPSTGDALFSVGAVDVVFGGPNGSASRDLGALDGSNGFRIIGAEARARFDDTALSSARYVNGDGFDDLIIADAQSIRIIYGGAEVRPPTQTTSQLGAGAATLTIGNDASNLTGVSVAAAGDVNGDGF